MTFNKARKEITKQLSSVYDAGELTNIADLVLEYVTNLTRTEQVKDKKAYLTCCQLENLDVIIERLKKNEPVQYVLGEAWFAGMKFKVNKEVLIPRPETEELVDWIIKEVGNWKLEVGSFAVLDIGTGSGCIAITLKIKLSAANISAMDICSEAIYTATENAVEHKTYIDFVLMDFLDENKWKELGQYDVIVSNPPYVRKSEAKTMHERVKDFEPSLALFVPDNDALIFYKKLADFANTHLKPGGSIFVEINEKLGWDVVNLFQSAGLIDIELRKDMHGKDRMVKAVLRFNEISSGY